MEIAKVDLCGVEPGSPGWEEARAAVTASMLAHGCVVVAHDAVDPEMHRALFGRALPELFALPLEVKQRNISAAGKHKHRRGYIGQIPGVPWETVRISQPTDAASVREFVDLLWQQDNPVFCETIVSVAKNMLKLQEMVATLTLEGLGVRRESISDHLGQLTHGMNVSNYGAPLDKSTAITLPQHRDDCVVTGIVQHEVEGLEALVADGRWVAIPPEPGTITFTAGEFLTVITNGRVKASLHRVRTPSHRERYAVLFSLRYKDGVVVHVLDDLVDADHPLMFKPVKHDDYSRFRESEEGSKLDDPLRTFCGVRKDGAMA